MFSLSMLFIGTLLLSVLFLVFTVAGVSQAMVNLELESTPVERVDKRVAPATTQKQGGFQNGYEVS